MRKSLIIFTNLLIGALYLFTNYGLAFINEKQELDDLIKTANRLKYRNHDSVIYFAEKAYHYADSIENPSKELDALFIMMKAYMKIGKSIKALNICDTASIISNKYPTLNRNVEVLINYGNIYQSMGFSSEALEFLFEAQSKLQGSDKDMDKADVDYYIALVNLGLGDVGRAHQFLRMALNSALSTNYSSIILSSYMVYSSSSMSIDSINKYILLADEVIYKNPSLLYEKVALKNNQALLNKALGNFRKSKLQYLEAINISVANGFSEHLANLYNNYAYLLMNELKYDSSSIILGKALVISKELNKTDLTASIYDSYSDYYSTIGNYKISLAYKDSSIAKRTEFNEQQRIQKSLFLSAVFEKEQQDKKILINENENFRLWFSLVGILAILAVVIGFVVYFAQKFLLGKARLESVEKSKSLDIADALIKGQNSERKNLARDLHDGLGAELGTLRFMVDGFFKDHSNYKEVENTLLQIIQNVRGLSHRMSPTQLDKKGLISTIRSMVMSINRSSSFNVKFDTNVTTGLGGLEEINLYYLILELVNNSLKHSGGDEIIIQLFDDKERLQLSVEDNGGGLDITKSSKGSGLNNIKTRVKFLGGTISVESYSSETLFLIEIPK